MNAFTIIRGGQKALMERLEQHPQIKRAVIWQIRECMVPTIYKERNPSGYIFNTILLAHFPKLIPLELVQRAFELYWKMKAFHDQNHSQHDPRSDVAEDASHLGWW